MLYKLSFLLTAFLCCTYLVSCTFQPSGSNYVEIDETDYGTSVPQIILSESSDTIAVPERVEFSYTVDTNVRRFYDVQIRLGNRSISSSSTKSGTFIIEPRDFDTGFHELIIRTVASTNTGSLADKLQAEALAFEKKWVVEIDNATPSEIPISEIEIVDGALFVNFDEYERINFDRYEIERTPFGLNLWKKIITIDSTHITRFRDYQFVYGKSNYRVKVVAKNGRASTGPVYTFELQPAQIMVEYDKNTMGNTITWGKPKIYKNISGYELSTVVDNQLIWSTENINDTTYYTDVAKFGNATILRLRMKAIKPPFRDFEVTVGERIDFLSGINSRISGLEYIQSQNEYFIFDGSKFYLLDLDNNNVNHTSAQLYRNAFKFGNKLIGSTRQSGWDSFMEIIDPANLNILETHHPSDFSNYEDYIFNMDANDEGMVMFNHAYYRSPTIYVDSLSIYNTNTRNLVQTFEGKLDLSVILNDNFALVYESLYKIQGDSLDYLLSTSERVFYSDLDSSQELHLFSHNKQFRSFKLLKVNLLTNSISETNNLSSYAETVIKVLPDSKTAIFVSDQNEDRKIEIINYETMALLRTIDISDESFYKIFYANGYLFDRNGFFIQL